MKLEQFKEIANENLRDLTVDERMVMRIHQNICTVKVQRKPRMPRASAFVAAACAVVMLISGGVLIKNQGGFLTVPGRESVIEGIQGKISLDDQQASTLASDAETSHFVDGSTLRYGIAQVGTFSEGYAPALATNGLYGYVNEDNIWVVRAIYDEAKEVAGGKAEVTVQNATKFIDIP